jgi:hypothetical protein
MFEKQANSGHGQQGRHETAGELLNIYIQKWQAEWRSRTRARHCGRATKIFNSRPTAVTANKGTRLRASYLFCRLKAGQMAVKPRGHRQRGRATNILNSKPTAVTANEGTRLRASYLFCRLKAGQMAVKPRGHRQRGRATNILNSKPTAVTANKGTRLRAKGRVNLTAAQP